ncbi:response regulator transcription factor [Enterocloster clostridioformis]|uniref:winged helix-turn-helix domain-containing protein n=1 Tax=Enterocloster clostridioformis TaxID=1531 RepID=UPI0026749986|nr:response regulator transcription factor [Enterocloster clostridioformis]
MEQNMAVIKYENLIINTVEQVTLYDNKEIELTNREFQVLYFLVSYQGQVFSKRQIYAHVTEFNEKDDLHTVEITISRIRKKLEQATGKSDFIITIRGRGYKFKK